MIARTDIVTSTTDRERAVRTLTSVFTSDPVCRWVWPEKDRFERYFPPFIGAFAGGAFDSDSAHVTEGAGGVALWLPPGVTSDEEGLGALAEESIDLRVTGEIQYGSSPTMWPMYRDPR